MRYEIHESTGTFIHESVCRWNGRIYDSYNDVVIGRVSVATPLSKGDCEDLCNEFINLEWRRQQNKRLRSLKRKPVIGWEYKANPPYATTYHQEHYFEEGRTKLKVWRNLYDGEPATGWLCVAGYDTDVHSPNKYHEDTIIYTPAKEVVSFWFNEDAPGRQGVAFHLAEMIIPRLKAVEEDIEKYWGKPITNEPKVVRSSS